MPFKFYKPAETLDQLDNVNDNGFTRDDYLTAIISRAIIENKYEITISNDMVVKIGLGKQFSYSNGNRTVNVREDASLANGSIVLK